MIVFYFFFLVWVTGEKINIEINEIEENGRDVEDFEQLTQMCRFEIMDTEKRIKYKTSLDDPGTSGVLKMKIYRDMAELNVDPPPDCSARPREIIFTIGLQPSLVHWGNLSVEILRDSRNPALTITKVLQAFRSIFLKLEPYNPALPVITRLYLADREKHDEVATEWTLRFAK